MIEGPRGLLIPSEYCTKRTRSWYSAATRERIAATAVLWQTTVTRRRLAAALSVGRPDVMSDATVRSMGRFGVCTAMTTSTSTES